MDIKQEIDKLEKELQGLQATLNNIEQAKMQTIANMLKKQGALEMLKVLLDAEEKVNVE